jgi:penicillin-binding protein 2
MVLLTLGMAAIVARLVYLQVIRGEYFARLSERNHVRVIDRPAPRGVITDRNGFVLADSRAAFMVSVVPAEFDTSDTGMLAGLLGRRADTLAAELERAGDASPYIPFTVASGLSVEEVAGLADNVHRMGGVILDVVPRRRYTMGPQLCHLLGYVGPAQESADRGRVVGRAGLEEVYDRLLRGEPGYRREIVDAYGRVVEEFGDPGDRMPVPGDSLSLALDAGLQRLAVEELDSLGLPGAVVVLDWSTGEALCLASWPLFPPNRITGGISSAGWDSLTGSADRPLLSRAWAAGYPPASTFKLVTAAYLLEKDLMDPDYLPDPCYGTYRLGGTEFGCWRSHGRLEVVDAIAYSCNIFFYQAAQLGSVDGLAGFASSMGLGGRLTTVLPGERSGFVPSSEDLDRMYGSDGWGTGNLLNLSVGQGELVATPLQVAALAGQIASAGEMPPVRVVLLGDSLIPRPRPASPKLSRQTLEVLEMGMRRAVTDPMGTLHRAMGGLQWDFYGKSGTAEVPGEPHSWVAGYLREPRPVALAVVVEHGGSGGVAAASLAARVLDRWLAGGGGG